jgi:hypothetical protein
LLILIFLALFKSSLQLIGILYKALKTIQQKSFGFVRFSIRRNDKKCFELKRTNDKKDRQIFFPGNKSKQLIEIMGLTCHKPHIIVKLHLKCNKLTNYQESI